MSLNLGWSDVIRLRSRIMENTRGDVPFSLHDIKGYMISTRLIITGEVSPGHLVKAGPVRVLHYKVTYSIH